MRTTYVTRLSECLDIRVSYGAGSYMWFLCCGNLIHSIKWHNYNVWHSLQLVARDCFLMMVIDVGVVWAGVVLFFFLLFFASLLCFLSFLATHSTSLSSWTTIISPDVSDYTRGRNRIRHKTDISLSSNSINSMLFGMAPTVEPNTAQMMTTINSHFQSFVYDDVAETVVRIWTTQWQYCARVWYAKMD